MHLVVFTLPDSADCQAALALLDERRASYEQHDLAAVPDVVEELQHRLGRAGQPAGLFDIRLPQVFCDHDAAQQQCYIGGLAALRRLLSPPQ